MDSVASVRVIASWSRKSETGMRIELLREVMAVKSKLEGSVRPMQK